LFFIFARKASLEKPVPITRKKDLVSLTTVDRPQSKREWRKKKRGKRSENWREKN
jgi:hypothetical protein